MGLFTYGLLRLIHLLQSFVILVASFWKRVARQAPLALTARRRRIPQHLAILFTIDSYIEPEAEEDRLLETIGNVVGWCHSLGIQAVSFYERDGKLLSCSQRIQDHLGLSSQFKDIVSAGYHLPTPPPSEPSLSRSRTPSGDDTFIKFQTNSSLCIYLLSAQSGKDAVADAANSLRLAHKVKGEGLFNLSIKELKRVLEEGPEGYPCPDFMLVHPLSPSIYSRQPLEMRGFPPLQSRLTEIHLNRYRRRHRSWLHRLLSPRRSELTLALTESEFCEALDDFSGAEMRFGK